MNKLATRLIPLTLLLLLPLSTQLRAQVTPAPIDGPRLTLTTTHPAGYQLGIAFIPHDETVWVDVNGNGICDRGEGRAKDNVGKTNIMIITLVKPSITIYGPVDAIRFGGLDLIGIDVTKMPKLKEIQCFNNQIDHLDLSGSTGLQTLFCFQNQISSLDLSACKEIRDIRCFYNQIGEGDMNALMRSLPDRATKKNGLIIALDTTNPEEQNVCSVDAVKVALDKNWEVNDFHGDKDNWTGVPYKGSPSALHELLPDTPIVYYDGATQALVLAGNTGAPYALYSETGLLLTSGVLNASGQCQIAMTAYPDGAYILNLGGESFKIYHI